MKLLAGIAFVLLLAGCTAPPAADTWRLKESDFSSVRQGMTRDDTLRILGKPYETWKFPRQGTEAWDYMHKDEWGYTAIFSVIFGADGTVISTLRQRPYDGGNSKT